MTTRGEAQAQLDDFIERTSSQTVTQYVTASATLLTDEAAGIMADLFPRLEIASDTIGEEAVIVAAGLAALADVISKAANLAIGTSSELGGDDALVYESPAWSDYVATQQAHVDTLPELDEETAAILADADAMAAIDEAEREEVASQD